MPPYKNFWDPLKKTFEIANILKMEVFSINRKLVVDSQLKQTKPMPGEIPALQPIFEFFPMSCNEHTSNWHRKS